ncbi:T9SS type A sorting domain-containing protein [Winogradskyella helgolandensis]|uniref:T9SS type A sorting domain-containing protein n=1 Tax=Winogradskyella helgolandensis TaxID=2697010 RepID=UPI0015B7DE30|nr:T9SS type A sorting domain-containing protein [Winogradskyella helgolandensis]
MKKITFLFMLLTVSLGFAQELPFTFTDGGVPTLHGIIGDVPEVIIANAVDPDDVTNDVLSITGSGNDWDNAQVIFANNLDLSDDSNNTITFRIKNTANDGVHTHALKFENGTGPNTELVFTTEDDQWKDISLDFPAGLGSYPKMVIFTDFGAGNVAVGTYLIDDIAGASHTTILPEFSLPVDFSDDFNDMMIGGDTTVSIVEDPDDATNSVLQVIGSGGDWDHAQATLVTPIDLSDDDNNTMRFRVRSTTAAPGEVNDHLFKLELPTSGGTQELQFSTTGTDWHDIELDFGSGLSSYSKLVLFVDSGLGNSADVVGTYLFDDILAPGADAEEPEPEPIINTDCAGQTDEAQQGEFTEGYNYSFVTTGTDVEFTFQLLDNKAGVVAYLWRQSPFTEFPMTSLGDKTFAVTISDLTIGEEVSYACKFAFAGGQAVTKYFTYEVGDDCTLGTENFETPTFKVFPNPTNNNWNIESNTTISSITVYDILGKRVSVLKPNATEARIDSSSLKSGVYFARVEGLKGSKSVKLIKE